MISKIKALLKAGKSDVEIKKILSEEVENEASDDIDEGEPEVEARHKGMMAAKKHFDAITEEVIDITNRIVKEYEIDTDEVEDKLNTICGQSLHKKLNSALDEYFGEIKGKIKAVRSKEDSEMLEMSKTKLRKIIDDLQSNNNYGTKTSKLVSLIEDLEQVYDNIKLVFEGKIKAGTMAEFTVHADNHYIKNLILR
jgi:DNA-binding FrmR family transcriptional regulator